MRTLADHAPQTFDEAAAALAAATAESRPVRIVGAGSKLAWGSAHAEDAIELHTTALDEIVAHNAGDMTATLQAGVPLERAQRTFAAAGQMLALDPPRSLDWLPEPTVGGVVATGDCGPLRHRYGAPRDLVVGATVALSDGTIARSGGTVIKNVAGYDLAKLLCGSFGTLGLILSVNVRLHPVPERTATAVGGTADLAALAAAAGRLAALPAELDALDVRLGPDGDGTLLARCAGPQAHARARRIASEIGELQGVEVREGDDEGLWDRQRAGQRSRDRAVVRVAAAPAQLATVFAAARACDGALVGRAALGHSYVEVAPDAVARLRGALPQGAAAVLLDAPRDEAMATDRWGEPSAAALALMRAVKARFDPAGTCNPGLFVGGI